MKTELYKAIKAINIKNLNDDDKEELLRMFMVTKNALIRNQIAFIFGDLHYDKAVPYIIKKINDKSTFNNNGSLVYSLQDMEVQKYFIEFIKIICVQEYESRLMAYEVVQKYAPTISNKIRSRAMKILQEHRIQLKRSAKDKGEDSTLHFVEKTKELLRL
jgi:hypothetical protein